MAQYDEKSLAGALRNVDKQIEAARQRQLLSGDAGADISALEADAKKLVGAIKSIRSQSWMTEEQRAANMQMGKAGGQTLGQVVSGIFTGEGRKLPNMEELSSSDIMGWGKDTAQTMIGEATTLDDQSIRNVWTSQLNDVGVAHRWEQDNAGNPILVYQDPETGEQKSGYINKPGVSLGDVPFITSSVLTALLTKGMFQRFAPTGWQNAVQASRAARYPTVAAGAAVGSVAMDQVSNMVGAETPISDQLSNAGLAAGLAFLAAPAAEIVAASGKSMKNWYQGMKSSDANAVKESILSTMDGEARKALDGASKEFWDNLASEAKAITNPDDARLLAIARAMQEEIPGFEPFRAYVTQNADDFADLDALIRKGAYGDMPQRIASEQQQANIKAIEQRGKGIQEEITGSRGDLTSAAETLTGSVREQERAASEAVTEAYGAASGFSGQFAPDALKQIDGYMDNALIGAKVKLPGVPLSPQYKVTKEIRDLFTQMGERDVLDIETFEATRQYIGNLVNAAYNAQDKRAARSLISAYDQWADDALDSALYSGDEQAIAAMRNARAKYREKMERFGGKDAAGKVISDILAEDMPARAVINKIFGTGATLGQGKEALNMLRSLEKATGGRGSDGWKAMQEAAYLKMFYNPDGAMKTPSQVAEMWRTMKEGDGRAWTSKLFGQDDFKKIDRFVSVLERMSPKTNVYVPSAGPRDLNRAQAGMLEKLSKLGKLIPFFVGEYTADFAAKKASEGTERALKEAGLDVIQFRPKAPVYKDTALVTSIRGAATGAGKKGVEAKSQTDIPQEFGRAFMNVTGS